MLYPGDSSSSKDKLKLQAKGGKMILQTNDSQKKVGIATPIQQNKLQSKKVTRGAFLVAQWLRICLLMQGTRVRALVWEDPTCRGATRPVSHNY